MNSRHLNLKRFSGDLSCSAQAVVQRNIRPASFAAPAGLTCGWCAWVWSGPIQLPSQPSRRAKRSDAPSPKRFARWKTPVTCDALRNTSCRRLTSFSNHPKKNVCVVCDPGRSPPSSVWQSGYRRLRLSHLFTIATLRSSWRTRLYLAPSHSLLVSVCFSTVCCSQDHAKEWKIIHLRLACRV